MSKAKYFDGLRAKAIPVELALDSENLIVRELSGNVLARWPRPMIYRDPSQAVAVVLGCGPGDERIELEDKTFAEALKLNLATGSRFEIGRQAKFLIFGLVLIIGACVAACLQADKLVHYLAGKISPQTEKRWADTIAGQQAEVTLKATQKAALDKLIARLTAGDPEMREKIKVHVVDFKQANAMTLPGGTIWILTGLFKDLKSPDELAGVLAHEMGHVEGRHPLEMIIRSALFTGALSLLYGDVSGVILLDPHTLGRLLGASFDRKQEHQADLSAVARLKASHVSLQGMHDFLSRMGKHDVKALSFLSNHPLSHERELLFNSKEDVKVTPALSAEEWTQLKDL